MKISQEHLPTQTIVPQTVIAAVGNTESLRTVITPTYATVIPMETITPICATVAGNSIIADPLSVVGRDAGYSLTVSCN